jgi:hypothetical protein
VTPTHSRCFCFLVSHFSICLDSLFGVWGRSLSGFGLFIPPDCFWKMDWYDFTIGSANKTPFRGVQSFKVRR